MNAVRIRIPSARHAATVLMFIVVPLTLLSTVGQLSKYVLGHPKLKGFVPLFYLDLESNVPTWYSSFGLAAAAVVLGLIAMVKLARHDAYRRHWAFLSGLFWLLSIDEVAMIHELPIDPLRERFHTTGLLYYPWVIFGLLFVGLVGISLLGFLRHLPAPTRNGFLLAGLVFVGGAIGVEMLSGVQADLCGEENLTYAMITTVEEFMEMTGVVILIYFALRYLHQECGQGCLTFGAERPAAPRALGVSARVSSKDHLN